MWTKPALILATTLMAGSAAAQMPPPPKAAEGDAPPSGRVAGQSVFFSPSGEVFKSPLGEAYPTAVWFAAADTDQDGALSREEFQADAMRFFAIVDVDGNKVISSQENSRYEQELAPEILGFSPLVKQPRVRQRESTDRATEPWTQSYQARVQGAAQFSLINEPQPIRAADRNFDFRITEDEWIKATTARFNLLDRNKDGKLTLDELPKTPLQIGLEERAAERAKQQRKSK
ncbi:MAG: hypothetical protein QM645_02220 [Asticcacaulis sp.]